LLIFEKEKETLNYPSNGKSMSIFSSEEGTQLAKQSNYNIPIYFLFYWIVINTESVFKHINKKSKK
jgi:hypothetical protein